MKEMEVATVDGPKSAGAVAAAPSLTVDAPLATASAKAAKSKCSV